MPFSKFAAGVAGLIALAALAGCGGQRFEENLARDRATEPTIAVRLPEGAGPFPAVVWLHSCSGLDSAGTATDTMWIDFFLANGYAVAIPDSFRPRGRSGGVCTRPGYDWVQWSVRGADAHKALRLLQANPKVDPARVSVMGRSNGGVSTLAAVNAKMAAENQVPAAGRPGFRSAIALYPECGIDYGNWVATKRPPNPVMAGTFEAAAPLLILIGALDDWTPPKPCEALVKAATGAAVSIKIYPNAHHTYDDQSGAGVRYNPNVTNVNGAGATTGLKSAALADSRQQVLKFFADPTYRPAP